MSIFSIKKLTSLGGIISIVLLAGIFILMARSQDVRGLLASWQGLHADRVGIYQSLVTLRSASELNYDEVSMLIFEQGSHQGAYLKDIETMFPPLYASYKADLDQERDRFNLLVENFKTHLAIVRISRRFLIQQEERVIAQSSLDADVKRQISLDLTNFAINPSLRHYEKARAAFARLEAAVPSDTSLLQALSAHKDFVYQSIQIVETQLAELETLLDTGAMHGVASELDRSLESYMESIYTCVALLSILVVVLMFRVVALSRRAENAVESLSELNAELDEKVRDATTELQVKMEHLEVEKVRAEDATRAKSEFLANMSHEIRTPLNGINGMAQILKRTELSKDQHSHINTILTSTGSLAQVINDILDFSKIEAGKVELENMDFSLLELVESAVDQVTLLANKSENQLVISYSSRLPEFVNSDPSRIRQVLLNLLSNANKFTHNGAIEVRAETMDIDGSAFFRIAVKDSGIGISEEKLAHIFEAFSQEDASTTRKFGGTGLGLTICKRLSELMGGDIQVSSVQGEGSTFSIYLPLNEATEKQKDKGAGPLRHIHAMIFDSNQIRLRAMRNHLESWNLPSVTFDDVGDFIVALGQIDSDTSPYHDVSCIIVDMDDYQQALMEALNNIEREIPKLYLTPLYSEEFGEFDRAIFETEVRSPIKPSAFLDALADAHSGHIDTEYAEVGIDDYCFAGKHVLLVDDNEINRTVAEIMLTTVNIEVTMAEDGKQAVDALNESQFDLVFMDCQMPVMDGYEASRTIRQMGQPSKRDIPIIAMTANAMKGDKELCLEAGMDDYIAKPVDATELYELMHKWLGHTHSEGIAARD